MKQFLKSYYLILLLNDNSVKLEFKLTYYCDEKRERGNETEYYIFIEVISSLKLIKETILNWNR